MSHSNSEQITFIVHIRVLSAVQTESSTSLVGPHLFNHTAEFADDEPFSCTCYLQLERRKIIISSADVSPSSFFLGIFRAASALFSVLREIWNKWDESLGFSSTEQQSNQAQSRLDTIQPNPLPLAFLLNGWMGVIISDSFQHISNNNNKSVL